MNRIPLVRAVHLNIYLAELRRIGAPVDRAIERAGLPATLEDSPDAYLLVPRVLDCVAACGGAEAAMHFGFRAAQGLRLEDLRPDCRRAILGAPSGLARIEALTRHCVLEDSSLRAGIVEEPCGLRIRCDLAGFARSQALAYSEWLQIYGVVAAVRSVAGDDWCPEEITFVAKGRLPDAARSVFAETRILTGQQHCSILVPRIVLARPCEGACGAEPALGMPAPGAEAGGWSFVIALRELLKPYLGATPPSLEAAAAMIGIGARSLQRRLAREGTTFKLIMGDARYQVACDLLADRSIKIIDVAFAAGYENPQHFSRAFRRIGGLTPRAFRAALAAESPAMAVCQPARTTRSQEGEHSRPIA